ncbi:MAG: acylphosphatase [Anaerolineales bacterium]
MNSNDSERLHAIVEGYVQGVGFRMFVQRLASELRLKGWVRNTWEGNVEVVAEGNRADLEKLLAGLKVGPRSAHVTTVHQTWLPSTGEFSDFRIRSTV